MTIVYTADSDQARAVLDLVRWFDNESTSLHHALVTMAQHNESDALDPEVQKYPAVVGHLTESAARWRAIAARVNDLSEKLGDVEALDDNPF
jgi:hypothetical protein